MFAIVIVTHEDLGEAYLRSATHILGKELPMVFTISVSPENSCCDVIGCMIKERISHISSDDEVLILVDLFGATPCNATMVCQKDFKNQVKVLSGLNFPMLLKALTSRHMPVTDVAKDIIATGQEGIFDATTRFF